MEQTQAPQILHLDDLITENGYDMPAPPGAAAAPGPAQSPSQSANPLLSAVAPPSAHDGAKEDGSPLKGAWEKFGTMNDIKEVNEAMGTATEASAGASTFQKSSSDFAKLAEEEPASPLAKVMAPINAIQGTIDTGKAIGDMSEHGVNLTNSKNLTEGFLTGGAGFLSSTGIGAPAAAVMSSAALGMNVGDGMANLADNKKLAGGWGQDHNETAMDRAADAGHWVDSHIGDKDPAHPTVLGGLASAGAGVAMGAVGAAQGAYNSVTHPGRDPAIIHQEELNTTESVARRLTAPMMQPVLDNLGPAQPLNLHDMMHHLDNVDIMSGGTMPVFQMPPPADADTGSSAVPNNQSVSPTAPAKTINYPQS